MQQGLLGRISRSSIMEYHAFGIISEGRHAKYHYMICGVQGDFTRGLVSDPPKTVWTRELKVGQVSSITSARKMINFPLILSSSLVSLIRPHYTNGESASALAQV
jgi:hypothetical protein